LNAFLKDSSPETELEIASRMRARRFFGATPPTPIFPSKNLKTGELRDKFGAYIFRIAKLEMDSITSGETLFVLESVGYGEL
jgi:hypothetical protein